MVLKGSIHCHDYDEDVFPCVQKCLLHYFLDMYHTTGDNGSSEFSLLFMELYNILKDAIATVGHESDEAVDGLKSACSTTSWTCTTRQAITAAASSACYSWNCTTSSRTPSPPSGTNPTRP